MYLYLGIIKSCSKHKNNVKTKKNLNIAFINDILTMLHNIILFF